MKKKPAVRYLYTKLTSLFRDTSALGLEFLGGTFVGEHRWTVLSEQMKEEMDRLLKEMCADKTQQKRERTML